MLCSDDLQFIQKIKNMQIATLLLTAYCHTSVHPHFLETSEICRIASIPTADILQKKRAPRQCFRRALNTVYGLHATPVQTGGREWKTFVCVDFFHSVPKLGSQCH